jgi:hypothetical protein
MALCFDETRVLTSMFTRVNEIHFSLDDYSPLHAQVEHLNADANNRNVVAAAGGPEEAW